MDIFSIVFLTTVSLLFGIILTLVVQYYVLVKCFNKNPLAEKPEKLREEVFSLPEGLKRDIDAVDKKSDSSLPISLMLQFLFYELRHTESVKRWLYKKLSLEFDELLHKTTVGKFFDAIKISDMNIGSQFPDIQHIALEDVKLDKTDGHIETLNVAIDIEYAGNFMLSIDAKMKFGKTAYLSIKLKKVCGKARLQFTRIPYTHWSISFYNDPVLELAVESHFQGRQLQANITGLIMHQIKKAIRRKHTLPNYKIRYKPFFVKTDPGQLDNEDSEIIPQGQLEMNCLDVTRLSYTSDIINVYCTFTVDSVPYISLYTKENVTYLVLELTLTKVRHQHLGVIFKQEQTGVFVDSITPLTPAAIAGLKAGDMLLAIENKNVNNVANVAKLIKAISSVNITLKVERTVQDYVFKTKSKYDKNEKLEMSSKIVNTPSSIDDLELETNSESLELMVSKKKSDTKVPKILAGNENMSKFAQTIGNFTLRKRKQSVERTSNDNSTKTTPNASSPGTPQHSLKHCISIPSTILLNKKHSIAELPEIVRTDLETQDVEILSSVNECIKGKELSVGSLISFNDDIVFSLKEKHKYLNINVWGINGSRNEILLGYTNISLSEILNECCNSMLGQYMRTYSFLPPTNIPPTNSTHPLMAHSGFEHVFCYGDILLSFVWNHDEDNVEVRPKIIPDNIETKPNIITGTVKHDFIRTQFHRTTHCDFCTKKIWLKDAVQCRQCGLCCHKKCITKCQVSTDCVQSDIVIKTDGIESDISIKDVIVQDDLSGLDKSDTDSSGELKSSCNLKRVNSANNLTIPGSHVTTCQSRSLPPSPQHTPSRKQSLVDTNPFILCPAVLDDVFKNPTEAAECVSQLLDHILLCPSDESLMDAAKDTGKQLYATVPMEEKVDKINTMMGELKKVFDIVTMEHANLSKQLNSEESEVEKTRLAFMMGKADAKMHAISALMLHYCTSLQQSQEKIV
ncbi:PDZ domain-containing protein 8 [Onthophagus taurus]|uniref:PDZ domain-containing protein 8 n=1 Tax=Onthophagus taurus TaxID=166361 RepID=UPI000C20D397|nr:PDZ domain-containing protein 8 [Onthophagus taurus]